MIDPADAVLSHFSLRWADLGERLDAAAAAGFGAIGLSVRAFAQAEASGLSAADQRRMADEAGVAVTEMEAVRAWPSGPEEARSAHATEDTAWRMADTFGCRYLQVIGPFGGSLEAASGAFGSLCDRAASHGVTVGIEFLPFTNISDASVAAAIVDGAGRPNGGVCVDAWHHFRGAADDRLLEKLTASRIVAVQFDDGSLLPEDPDYYTDCLENRRVPGEGEFDLVGFVRLLDAMDVSVPVSIEVISTQLQALPAVEAATRMRDGLYAIIEAARS
jgi:sugar phosphate isomerase/epimerase